MVTVKIINVNGEIGKLSRTEIIFVDITAIFHIAQINCNISPLPRNKTKLAVVFVSFFFITLIILSWS